jgi:hypothetical protein
MFLFFLFIHYIYYNHHEIISQPHQLNRRPTRKLGVPRQGESCELSMAVYARQDSINS